MAMKEFCTCIALGMLCCVGFPALAQPRPAVPSRVPPLSDYPGFDRNPPVLIGLPGRQLTGAAS
jgi:hypothetical protein